MKTHVSVECTKCLRVGDEYEHIYCQRCMNEKAKELHEQDEKIKELEKKIAEFENEKERLHEKLMEYRT